MAKLLPIDPAGLGILQLVSGQWRTYELGTRDGSSPRKDHGPAQVRAERSFLVNGNKIQDAIVFFLGDAAVDDDSVPASITRRLPQPFPDDSRLIATSVATSGHQFTGNQTGNLSYSALGEANYPSLTLANSYTKARLEVTYTLEPYRADIPDQLLGGEVEPIYQEYSRYVSVPETRSAAEYLPMPHGLLNYIGVPGVAGGTRPITANIGKIFPLEEYPVTWHRVPFDAWGEGTYLYELVYGDGTELPYLGTVNKTTFKGRQPGTLLFQSVRAVQEPSPVGTKMEWRLEYGMTFDPNGWNRKYYFEQDKTQRAARNGWYFVGPGTAALTAGSIADGDSIYNEREFADLFTVGS